jgi:hypothetical protein
LEEPSFTNETEFKAFSEDLCEGWLRLEYEPVLDPDAVPGYPNLYRRSNCSTPPAYEAFTTVQPPNRTATQFFPEVQGTSADGRCTIFRVADALTAEAPDLGENSTILYEACEGAALRLVAVLPNGAANPSASTAGTGNVNASSPNFQGRTATVHGALSGDGSRVYWSASGIGTAKIYLRLNADQAPTASGACDENEPLSACTVAVSPGTARFWAAAADGSRAIYSEGGKLFEFRVAIEAGLPVSETTLIAEGEQGLLGASADATRIYFASTKALGGGAIAGKSNLYYREAGQAPAFIGVLAANDLFSGNNELEAMAITPEPAKRAARVSSDGLHAAFMSHASLTGFDNSDSKNDEADAEVFVYDAGAGKLACASCDPSGARPEGRNIGGEVNQVWAAAQIPTWESQLYASRPLADDGSRLFFDSFTPLLQRDTNGRADVYEWQSAASQKDCEEAGAERYVESAAGCLSLISSGESNLDSEFLDASASGGDVFFATGASLLPQDPGLIDVYDARAGGGFPPPPPPSPECEGQACQNPSAPPQDPTPASSTYVGPGNVSEPKPKACPKGKHKVKKNGKVRCVKNKAKKQSQKSKKQSQKGRAGR